MKKTGTTLSKGVAAVIAAVSLSLVMVLGFLAGAFDYLEYKTYDLRVNLFAESTRPSEDIMVILLDQDSIDWAREKRDWGWPWPRKAYAEFVNYMNLGGAKSVAFDVIFSEPSIYRNANQDAIIDRAVNNLNAAQSLMIGAQDRQAMRGTVGPLFREITKSLQELSGREDDLSFVKAEEEFGRVVQTVFFSTQSGNTQSWPEDLNKPLFTTENFGSVLSQFDLAREERDVRAQFPIPELRQSAGVIGNVTGVADSDSIFRRIRLFTLFDGKAVPGLSAASLLVSGDDSRIRYNEKTRRIEWGDRSIPVDKEGKTILRFRGGLDRYFPYSAADILKSAESHSRGEEPLIAPENFKDKYIFFGYYAPGLFDICSTPISSVYPGMGMHITMLDNILQGDFIRESPLTLNILIIVLAVVLIIFIVLYSGRIPLVVSGTVLVFAILIALGIGSYQAAGLWVPMAAPILAAIFAFLTSTLYSYATEGSQKRFIKSAFSRYLSPAVINEIINDPSRLNLGGEKREMSAIFTDIQSFSTISSKLQDQYGGDGPKVLVNLLNLYLTEMSNIVLAHQGTIDKFEGDAIIAFFGAPLRVPNHANLACKAALRMKKREAELKAEFMNPGGQFFSALDQLIAIGKLRKERPLYTRVGINTGDMVVGNMGTPDKMDYTIMGNAVNLAARLEGVNKQYDTHGILISEYTRAHIGEDFIIRPLSRVRVVGISTPLRLYELLELREEAPTALVDMTGRWQKAMETYEGGDFAGALNIFRGIREADEKDDVAKLYIERCDRYIKNPPSAEEWDNGVDNLTSK
jgi:class 3 adenylate cyclase/CHASE2 domain-containing sensor protein